MVKTPSEDDIVGTIVIDENNKFDIPEEVNDDDDFSVMTPYKTVVHKGRSITFYNNKHPELENNGQEFIRIKIFGGEELYYRVDTTKVDD